MPTGVPEGGTDVGALASGYASVTPLQLDLTAYHALTNWGWDVPTEAGDTTLWPKPEAKLNRIVP